MLSAFTSQKHGNIIVHISVEVRHWTEETSSSSNNESFEESYEKTVEEGDMVDHDGRISGAKMVQFERITIHKSVREFTPKPRSVSRTPSEEQITREDSAYMSQKSHASRSSSITSLTSGKSEDNLVELISPGDSIAQQHPSHDWYSEYSTQTFQNVAARMEYVRSKSQYDSHIAEIRGKSVCNSFILFDYSIFNTSSIFKSV